MTEEADTRVAPGHWYKQPDRMEDKLDTALLRLQRLEDKLDELIEAIAAG